MSPIAPSEVAKKKLRTIPKVVFDVLDTLIVENFVDGVSIVKQADLIQRVKMVYPEFKTEWLNVEAAYEAVGWRVEYDKPGFNEGYGAAFKFTA